MGLGNSSLNLSEEYVEEIAEETGCKFCFHNMISIFILQY